MSKASTTKYVLDANAFIQAKRRFYQFDFCPGYWASLAWHQKQGTVWSIDKVLAELEQGNDELPTWAKSDFGKDGFADTTDAGVVKAYGDIATWVSAQSQFVPQAVSEFQAVADGWLVAYAIAKQCTVVTLEEHDPNCKRRVKVPNVCHAFGVNWISPFELLGQLKVKLVWNPPN